MTEAEIKLYLQKAATDAGIYCRRIEQQFMVGFPDMIFKHPDREWLFVEVKWLRAETRKDTYPNRMSVPQRRCLTSMEEVNAKAYLLTVTKKRASYILRFTTDFWQDTLPKDGGIEYMKNHGKKWPVLDFLLALG